MMMRRLLCRSIFFIPAFFALTAFAATQNNSENNFTPFFATQPNGVPHYEKYHFHDWRMVMGLGAALGITGSRVGANQTIPIVDPNTDLFYTYTPTPDAQTAFGADAKIGTEVHNQVMTVQMGLEYLWLDSLNANGTLTQGADQQSEDIYQFNYTIQTQALFAELKCLFFNPHHDFQPYVEAGMGPSFNSATDFNTTAPPFLTFTRQYADYHSTYFGFMVGLGLDVPFKDHWRAGIGYRFIDFDSVSLGTSSIDQTPVWGTLSQSHLYVNEVLTHLTYIL